MRKAWLVLTLLFLAVMPVAVDAAGKSTPPVVSLAAVSHAIQGRTLVISGLVENRGAESVSRLVIDAQGFSPGGDLTVLGTDGIPWEIRPESAERFSIALPIATDLVREYVVRVSALGTRLPLAEVRRGIDVALYRPLLLSTVRVDGDIRIGLVPMRGTTLPIVSSRVLRIHTSVNGLPVTDVTVRATILFFDLIDGRSEVLSLDLDVPAEGMTDIPLPFGVTQPTLLNLRVVDVRLKATWSE